MLRAVKAHCANKIPRLRLHTPNGKRSLWATKARHLKRKWFRAAKAHQTCQSSFKVYLEMVPIHLAERGHHRLLKLTICWSQLRWGSFLYRNGFELLKLAIPVNQEYSEMIIAQSHEMCRKKCSGVVKAYQFRSIWINVMRDNIKRILTMRKHWLHE